MLPAIACSACKEEDEYMDNPDVSVGIELLNPRRDSIIDLNTFVLLMPQRAITGQNGISVVKIPLTASGKDTILAPRNYTILTNMGAWHLAADAGYESNIRFFPTNGVNSGRFGIDILANPYYDTLNYALNVVDSKGVVRASIRIKQLPSSPAINLSYSSISLPYEGGKVRVGITGNGKWVAEPNRDWIHMVEDESSDSTLTLLMDENGGNGNRSGTVKITLTNADGTQRVEESATVNFRIDQFTVDNDFDDARKLSIAELLTMLPAEQNGEGTIVENCYIEGYVTSDYSRRALTRGQMVVEDESGKGIVFEFIDAENNTFPLNEKVTIHMYNAKFVREVQPYQVHLEGGYHRPTGLIKVYPMPTSFVRRHEPSAGITPAEIDRIDKATLSQYENRLVTIKGVEFALPRGTYCNNLDVDIEYAEAHRYGDPKGFYLDGSAPGTKQGNVYWSETPLNYGHILRDRYGNTMKLTTSSGFLDRHKMLMPWGSGDITGIVMKKVKVIPGTYPSFPGINPNEVYLEAGETFTLRLRNNDDNKVAHEREAALSRDIMQIGPWTTENAIPSITATVGSGTLKFSGRINQNAQPNSSADVIYFVSGNTRMVPSDVVDDGKTAAGTPVVPFTSDGGFWDVNTQYWWAKPSSIMPEFGSGEAWILTTSTSGTEGGGPLFISFLTSSSSGGPGPFRVEWSENENAPVEDWIPVVYYGSPDVDLSLTGMQYSFRLPDAMKGKATVYIRLRVTKDQRTTYSNYNTTTTGTNRIGMIRITQLKENLE
ncbi:MAG: DUF5689 domain-containing protein [Prevotellaceae bacterium]|jgi:hypothetical protein|nr:DUF5689 domain-containing protein [Prevotellaceae bacterium]